MLYNRDMLTAYVERQMKKAQYKLLGNRTYFGEIPGIRGVWANAKNLENCRHELQEALEGWLLLKVHSRESVPGFVMPMKRELAHHA
jgi:predicted RNase H-like HicB family nuclease